MQLLRDELGPNHFSLLKTGLKDQNTPRVTVTAHTLSTSETKSLVLKLVYLIFITMTSGGQVHYLLR